MDVSKFEEIVSTPNPEDYNMDSAVDFSWIKEMLEEKKETKLQSVIDENRRYLAELEACFSPYNNPVPDIIPSTSSAAAKMGTEQEQATSSSSSLINLEGSTDESYAEESPAPEKSGYNLLTDYVWTPDPEIPLANSANLWPCQTVSCFTTLPSQTLGPIFFFIDCGESDWDPSSAMTTTVLDDNNNQVPVEMSKEKMPPFSNRYLCAFIAHTPGHYSITVCDESLLNLHIKGSPFQIAVTRNYKMYTSWIKPRIFFKQALKAWGIAHSPTTKRVYITDRDAHQIVVYYENGMLDKCFGSRGQDPGQFYRPTGIAVDNHNQRLIITDKDNHRVCVYSLNGNFLFSIGRRGFRDGEFHYPWGVAVSPKDSTIAIVDSRNHRLQLFDAHGNFLRKYSVFEKFPFEYRTEFNYPRGVSFDKTGDNLYVTDFTIETVFKLNIELTKKSKIVPPGVNLSRPQGITLDAVGNLLICDSRNNCIQVISADGEHISSIVGHADHSFLYPQDIIVVPTGEILVLDSNSNIRVL